MSDHQFPSAILLIVLVRNAALKSIALAMPIEKIPISWQLIGDRYLLKN